jgi:prepilin-type processing-associated H-X9-DG protein
MQYRLSTIFLVFFVTAASLALFGTWGLWVAFVLCIAALAFNKGKTSMEGGAWAFFIVLIGILCPGLLPAFPGAREAARRCQCMNNLKQIGFALNNYENEHQHFPPVNVCDKDGKPLFSWMVEILPQLERQDIYDRLHKDEPWDSAANAKILDEEVRMFICPSAERAKKDFSSNYIAIIGPGTIWRNDGPTCLKDLSNTSLTVAAVECVDSGKHWAEPYALTAEEAIERMKTGEGMRISTAHSWAINVLFADGHEETLRAEMPISVWRKLLKGEIKDESELSAWQENPDGPSPTNISVPKSRHLPGAWPLLLSILVFVISILLLFHRAWASRNDRKKAESPA